MGHWAFVLLIPPFAQRLPLGEVLMPAASRSASTEEASAQTSLLVLLVPLPLSPLPPCSLIPLKWRLWMMEFGDYNAKLISDVFISIYLAV